MRAFHGDEAIKKKYLDRLKEHARLDEIVKGQYWENGKGCAVGCTIHSDDHNRFEDELGIPTILARLEDCIFERLPNDLAKTWPIRFLESIPVGKDLWKVWPKFAIFLLTDKTQCDSKHPQCKIVADKFNDQLNGMKVDWRDVASSADSASSYAASSTAYAASAASAAYADSASAYAASSTAYAAADAAYAVFDTYSAASASYAADVASDYTTAIIAQSEKLLELLSEIET